MSNSADVYVAFGGDTSKLEEAGRKARETLSNVTAQMRSTADSFRASGQQADSAVRSSFAAIGERAERLRKQFSDAFKAMAKENEDAMAASQDQSQRFKDTAESVYGAAKTVTAGLAAIGVAATGYLLSVGVAATKFGDEVRAAAGAFDQSFASVGSLRVFADRANVELNQLGNALTEMSRKAREGDEATVKALSAIGVSVDELRGKSGPQQLALMAQAFERSADSSNKAAAAHALFGQEVGDRMIPLLNRGRAAIEDMAAIAERTGTAIGPALASKLSGTSEMFSQLRDRVSEFNKNFEGMMLQSFQNFKPAIDGIIAAFRDLVGNVSAAIQYFNDLGGASAQGQAAMNGLGSAAKAFSIKIVEAIAYLQEMAVAGVKYIDSLGVSFAGLGQVVSALGQDIMSIADSASAHFREAWRGAIANFVAMLGDLKDAFASAMSLDMSGIGAAVDRFKGHASEMGNALGGALSPDLFSRTRQAWDDMRSKAGQYAGQLDGVIAKIRAQRQAQIDLIEKGGQAGKTPGADPVSDPRVKQKAGGGQGRDDGVREEQLKIEGEIQALRSGLDLKQAMIAEAVKLKISTEREGVAANRDATQREYADERAALQRMMEIENLKPSQRQQINNRIQQLEAKHNQEMLRLAGQNVEAVVKEWHKMVDAISSSLSSSITGMITGQKRLVAAVRDIGRAIVGEFVRMGVQIVTDWAKAQMSRVALAVAGEAQLTAAVTAGVATRQAAEASGEAAGFAMKAASMAKSIMASAGETFAGVFGFLSPVMGPAAAGPAAAASATVASVASFDIGAWSINRDQTAVVHRNEMIMDAGRSDGFRKVIDLAANTFGNGQKGGGDQAAGDMHLHLSAVDGRDMQRKLLGNGRALMREVGRAVRNGANLGVRGLSKA